MKDAVRALIIAVDIIVACALILLVYRNYSLSAQLASMDAQKLNEAKSEYMISSIESLEGVSLKGTTVINAVKKYKDDLTVRVVTTAGQREFDDQTPFLNVVAAGEIGMNGQVSQSGETIIDPDGIFYCTHESNLNDVVTCLVFTQKGATVTSVGDDYWTAANIRQTLLRILDGFGGVDSSTDTGTLLSIIEENCSYSDKCKLADIVGGSSTQSYNTLVGNTETKVKDLNSQITQLKDNLGSMYEIKTGTMSSNANGDLNATPVFDNSPVMAYVQDTSTRCTYYYYQNADNGGFWVSNDDPSFEGSTFDKLAFVRHPDTGFYLYSKISGIQYTVVVKPNVES